MRYSHLQELLATSMFFQGLFPKDPMSSRFFLGSNANVAQLAASIKHRILENELCEIDCLGPDAIFRSLAAMDLATVFVQRERSEQLILCLRPEEMHVTSVISQDDLSGESGDAPGQIQGP